ncbi:MULTISPECIES: macrolide ABC transporter ATP-binding protein/permease MacB [Proteus]|jgi:macrolide transport system ATP-binding/permease protein|uniref:Macrolide transporter ATP-binding /permease protein n=3 Tax=Enterobacterales TaxID=91347 RepID=A0A379F570_PROVU|nr:MULTISPECIES: macrolide ABC transporter ATP-binding protein/permease MacB [Proteus]NBN61468.1 macrolide ABC transporter ATP-binding protein/permease MacB [Proteus sp. G2639]RNT26678.1 MacB family efflux pump subunit [Proteus mirabilis]AYY80015.1 MacB family efflux pump subunit [Proteus vulgaris]KGA59450.1 macrolide export ATP-binding/permease protein MacB [Proteus vulgaris]MBG5971000.1 macrolide ABC transporter ATP-binding protein/permease MacB [Proteus vulgaris]
MPALLELNEVSRVYSNGEEETIVLNKVSLTINAGEMVAIMGASGSGKSTLMNILGCLDKPSRGEYKVAGQSVAQMEGDQLAALRREHFGFIFQRYHLMAHLSAEQNVEIPAIYADKNATQRKERARELLTRLGLGERVDYRPNQLSGGQQQRVSIARALMNGGEVILADEPTGALDSHSGKEVMAILKQLNEQGHTVIIVTHDPLIAEQADRIIEIKDGKIISDRCHQTTTHKIKKETTTVLTSSYLGQIVGRFTQALEMAWRAMVVNKVRTLLTMLGIIIGIASVVTIIVIGDAAKSMVLSDIKAIGSNTIDIYPGKDFGSDSPEDRQSLTLQDVFALKQQSYVQAVTPQVQFSTRLRRGNQDSPASVAGVSDDYFTVYAMKFSQGRSFTHDMIQRQAQVVVIDENTRHRFFPNKKNVIGEQIIIRNIPSTIIGVIADKKSVFGNGQSLRVWVPYSTLNSRILNRSYLDSITVRAIEGYDANVAEQQIIRLLTIRHGKKDIFTYNLDSFIKAAESTTQTMQLFLTFVAVISLVVGGIGVMNIMLVSVTERTREIGIRMAVGARASDVMQQFLIESVLVCLVGGVLGIGLSFSIAIIASVMLPEWHFVFQPIALVSAFICSTAIGVIFGFLPARRAAKMNPIDALARE